MLLQMVLFLLATGLCFKLSLHFVIDQCSETDLTRSRIGWCYLGYERFRFLNSAWRRLGPWD